MEVGALTYGPDFNFLQLTASNRRTVGLVSRGQECSLVVSMDDIHGAGPKGGGRPWLCSIGNYGGQGEVLDRAERPPSKRDTNGDV
ncbi:hypothetical protein ABIE28_003634 [Devosia sp. 2618]